jgi:2-polyprenyl-3-methyl-5-hydroxy-6-metoxy-1,4-benzoquinol methylase
MGILHRGPSPFGEMLVTWSARSRTVNLYHAGFLQSRADSNGVSKVDYIHAIHGLAIQGGPRLSPLFSRHRGDVLMLGCGGGTIGTMLARDGYRVTVIDVNPIAFELARRFFSLDPSVACLVEDGFGFLKRTRAKFDIIICDMYLGSDVAPYAGAPEFIALAAKRLRTDGRIFMNVIVYGDLDPTADRVAMAAQSTGLKVRILDGTGYVGRNAVVAIGAVDGLRRPRLRQPPETGRTALDAALDRYKFRRPSKQRAFREDA